MDVKEIGVKKNRLLISLLLILAAIAFVIACFFMWFDYASQDRYKYLSENAIEVEATIVSYHYDYSTSSKNTRNWATVYEYESEWGTVYKGRYAVHTDESTAKAEVGEKIKIYIDPNSDWSDKHMPSFNYERALIDAIIWSFPVPIVLYLLIYRCIYRNIMNKKIQKKVYGSTYNNDRFIHTPLPNTVTQGEVTKVLKMVVCYVKVKYKDERDATREKWARAWFTHKEATFLKHKKMITIVPYKNTYGILEEMPADK